MANGKFVLDGMVGCPPAAWTWDDPKYLEHTWKTSQPVVGQTSVSFVDERQVRRYRAITFETRKKGDKIIALWANGIRSPAAVREAAGTRFMLT